MLKRFFILAVAAFCLSAAKSKTVDNVHKQMAIYNILWHVGASEEVYSEMEEQGRSWDIRANIERYTNKLAVEEFLGRYEYGMLPRGEVFSVFYPEHREEAIALFDLFYYAKDFETFYRTALWARIHVNEYQFNYAMAIATIHRPDTRNIHLPAIYELNPHHFFNSDVINKAQKIRMQHEIDLQKIDEHNITANYSGWYMQRDNDFPEMKLNYFTEDIGLNEYYWYLNQEFPFWMSSDEYEIPEGYRGQHYLSGHKLLLNRYYLERLSNDMGEIEDFDWNRPFKTGYHPTMTHGNSLPFPQREHWSRIPSHKFKYIQDVQDIESRISGAIDSGYIMDLDGKLVNISGPNGLNLLGNIIEGNADSHNEKVYGCLDALSRNILGFSLNPASKYQIVPSALEHFTTSMRDPAFYRLYKRIINYVQRYNNHLPAYTYDELIFSGVKIESVTVDRLSTYFDHFDTLLNHAVMTKSQKDDHTLFIKAKSYRLNHKPFTFHITVNSNKATRAVFRIFLGPKYDAAHNELDISENYMNFYEMDQWVANLNTGRNKIERSSDKALFVMPDRMCSYDLYKKLQNAIAVGEPIPKEPIAGFPQRLLLPKGKKEGMPFQLFVYVSHLDETQLHEYSSPIWGDAVFDNKAMGFPLDRRIYAFNFTMPNMFFRDVHIFHTDSL